MKTGAFWIGGKHAVLSAIKNPKRKINKLIITEENQKDFNLKNFNKTIPFKTLFTVFERDFGAEESKTSVILKPWI